MKAATSESHNHYPGCYCRTCSLDNLVGYAPMFNPPIYSYVLTRPQSPDHTGIWMFAKTSVYHLLSALHHLRFGLRGKF